MGAYGVVYVVHVYVCGVHIVSVMYICGVFMIYVCSMYIYHHTYTQIPHTYTIQTHHTPSKAHTHIHYMTPCHTRRLGGEGVAVSCRECRDENTLSASWEVCGGFTQRPLDR